MLADQLDYIVGVDPHRDAHALAVVHVVSGAIVFEATVLADSSGYLEALELVEEHAPGRRAFAIEGTGSYGLGLTRFLTGRAERVLEVGRLRRERRWGGKTDALDAVRAARSVLTNERPSTPRAGGERQALQALVAAREGAVNAKRAGVLSAARSADHNTGAATKRVAAAHTSTAAATSCSNPTRRSKRRRTARQPARATLDRTGASCNLPLRNANSHVRSKRSLAGSHRSYSNSPASDPMLPPSWCSPGHTEDGSPRKQPSHDSPAPHRSPPPPARPSATASTEAATENSTGRST
jgi:hypothetical protein